MEEEPTSGGLRGLQAGSRFGNYRLKRLLGKGGFGHVWEAYDTVMDRVVALKLLRSDYSENERFRQRLFREARAAGRLHEPHVVPIHQCGEIDGQIYIDMRLILGTDLETVLAQQGALAPARAVAVIRQIASALDAAHSEGLIHRDVKPANILLTDDDFAYLVDFGLANAASDAKLTSTGMTIGTFAYMAPERLRPGAEVDRRADVYALACVLYECLTGSPPYSGDMPAVVSSHLSAAIPRPSNYRQDISVAFDDVIARGMAKQPAARFPSAGELASAAHSASGFHESPTLVGPNTRQPGSTRHFSARWSNPDGTGDTPYPEDLRVPDPVKRQQGYGRMVLAGAAVTTLLAAAVVATSLILRNSKESPRSSEATAAPKTSISDSESVPATTSPASTASQSEPRLPGTNAEGFVGYPGAQCDPGSTPAMMGRTTKSLVVICEVGPAYYYYRGFRLLDGASIELSNAVRSSGGFDVTNPVDGTRYQVRPNGISITTPDGQVFSEPMIAYAAS